MREHAIGSEQIHEASTSAGTESNDSIGGSSTATLERDFSDSSTSTLSMDVCYDNPVLSMDDDVSARGVRPGPFTISACSSAANSLPSTSRSIDVNQNDLPRAERQTRKLDRIPWIAALASAVDTDPLTSPLELEKRPSCVPAYIAIFVLLFIVLAVGGVTTIYDVRPAFLFGKPLNSSLHLPVDDFPALHNNSTLLGL
ncbi:hypothetical protein PFISCL1PPCAC_8589 [Pristionchus fissidentatus]|uniref:Transmembrane protein n=1 Tax=Pristionchus fissidentatus TaxID=1538716 RepID=A0AAV5VGN7_9BILA|nr:hypothetical protein PFISCL1PPCAC_8589 [Pristionchus fissidentatus]